MSHDRSLPPHPTAHLPELFVRALKTGTSKGGIAIGESSPLLPWLRVPGTEVHVEETFVGPAEPAPAEEPGASPVPWLRLAFQPTRLERERVPSLYTLRTINHVGFGF